jgi:hypothetical protein
MISQEQEAHINFVKSAEAFMRRAALIDAPFMLKGSFVTCQYMDNPQERIVNDMDWVYIGKVEDTVQIEAILSQWMIDVTEIELNDGVKFMNFKENRFWRRIDYAMSDDFPTVNGIKSGFNMDMSWGLDIYPFPDVLEYKPLHGSNFMLPYTCPLSLQVAWKLHQTLVRPRFKDVFDLIQLLKNQKYTHEIFKYTLQSLIDECHHDKVDIQRMAWLLDGKLGKHPNYSKISIERYWNYFLDGTPYNSSIPHWEYYSAVRLVTNPKLIPQNISVWLKELAELLKKAGFSHQSLQNLPRPRQGKKTNMELEK